MLMMLSFTLVCPRESYLSVALFKVALPAEHLQKQHKDTVGIVRNHPKGATGTSQRHSRTIAGNWISDRFSRNHSLRAFLDVKENAGSHHRGLISQGL